LQFTLKDPFNFFLSLLALSFSSILKEDRAIFSRPIGRDELVSAGPFRFAPSDSPQVDRLVRNDRFVNGRPFLDSMEIRRDIADIPQALSGNELDMAYNIPASSAGDFKRLLFGGELRYYTSRYCYGLIVNFTKNNYITRNADFRRALAAAIDKDQIVRDVLDGKAIRADAVLPPESLDIGGRVFVPYDPDGAGRIIESCRTSEDLSTPIKVAFRGYATIPNLPEIAERLSRMLTRLGLKVVTSFHPASTPIAAFKDDYDLVFLGFLSELDLFSALEPFINPEGGDNYFGYRNPGLFRLLNDSRTIKDNGARKEFFIDILEKLTMDVFMIPLFFKKSLLVRARNVHSIVLSAEESFYPDAVYLSATRSVEPGEQDRSDVRLLGSYGDAIRKFCAETAIVADTSNALIKRGKDIGTAIALQKSGIGEADGAFTSFAESAAKVQAARVGIVERIRGTLEVTAKSGEAAGLIRGGLHDLSTALEGTVKALGHVKEVTRQMLGIVLDIGKSNEFISSVAINAAIIAAKADSRGGDLVKVSQSISLQAKRNTENTDAIRKILEDMDKTAGEHFDFLGNLVGIIGVAADRVSKSGDILGKIGPVLSSVNARCDAIEDSSARLADRIREAELSVDQINIETNKLALDAETLQFGLDMEQGVTDILMDVSSMNQSVCSFLLDPAGRAK
ncbi:MAG: ABC transporter substrate-binding protein, partial [Spirochaetaceae bacterium]|nr:ABC transporter substrate-binding protein [Spirochaetaceae bacterium]